MIPLLEFGLLTEVTSVQLQENTLTGTLPTEIGRMALTKATFKVFRNSLSGRVPSEFGMMTELVGGALHTNKLSGALPTGARTRVPRRHIPRAYAHNHRLSLRNGTADQRKELVPRLRQRILWAGEY